MGTYFLFNNQINIFTDNKVRDQLFLVLGSCVSEMVEERDVLILAADDRQSATTEIMNPMTLNPWMRGVSHISYDT